MTALRTLRQHRDAETLLVLLPGAYMTPEDYAAHYFPAIGAHRLDLCAVELGVDLITSGEAIPAIREQILQPARGEYTHLWLGGISLGGLLSLCLNADHPGLVDGLCLIAPYPGSRLTSNAIARAGGLAAWQPTPEQLSDGEFRMWQWLKQPPADLPVFVGYGAADRFASGMAQIAACFPPDQRTVVTGDHDWPAWQALWAQFLASGLLPG